MVALVAFLARWPSFPCRQVCGLGPHFEAALGEIAPVACGQRNGKSGRGQDGWSIAPQAAVAPEPKSEHQIIADRMARAG